jgi:hypothetical protein
MRRTQARSTLEKERARRLKAEMKRQKKLQRRAEKQEVNSMIINSRSSQ